MEVAGDFCSSEAVSLRQMAASLVEAVAVEAVLVAQKSVYLLLVMGSLLDGRKNFLDQESENSHGFDDILIGMKEKNTRHVGDGVAPENKDDGDSENDDEDEDDEEDDDGGNDEDASGDEDNDNQGDEDQEDDVEANGEGGSDEEEDDEEEDEDEDEDEDEEDEDGEDEEEDEEEEEMLEPPIKKKK